MKYGTDQVMKMQHKGLGRNILSLRESLSLQQINLS